MCVCMFVHVCVYWGGCSFNRKKCSLYSLEPILLVKSSPLPESRLTFPNQSAFSFRCIGIYICTIFLWL